MYINKAIMKSSGGDEFYRELSNYKEFSDKLLIKVIEDIKNNPELLKYKTVLKMNHC